MIRQTVERTMAATYLVRVPDKDNHDFPTPCGTGFFVSPDGLFVTAGHVTKAAYDQSKIELSHEVEPGLGPLLKNPQPLGVDEKWDLALLKFEFEPHRNQEFFRGRDGFEFLEIELEEQREGTPVYSFGYPLPGFEVREIGQEGVQMVAGLSWICPRVTSAIISSRYHVLGPIQEVRSRFYVMDKAFNYGNSGGPIVLQETGTAIGVVVRFQPVQIPQQGQAEGVKITIPSLYGIASSLRNILWDEVRKQVASMSSG